MAPSAIGRRGWLLAGLCALTLCLASPAQAGPFDQGRVRGYLSGGTSLAGGGGLVINGGVAWFIIDGFSVGLDGAVALFSDPLMAVVGPQFRYVFELRPVAPYAGVFHRHRFTLDDLPDTDAIGWRAGVMIPSGGAFLLLGVAQEWVVRNCTGGCTQLLPEFGLSVGF